MLGIQLLYDGIVQLWTYIFHVRHHSMARLVFIGKKLVLERLESPPILFYFKRENKTRKKTLKELTP